MLKKIGIAAALTLVAVSAMATNFRASDQVYIPAAGHLVGGGGITFISDVQFSNLESFPVTVSVIFSQGATGSQTAFNNLFTLAANERREIRDFVGTPNSQGGLGQSAGFGMLVFNGCRQGASCTDAADPQGLNFGRISVESRVYSIPAGKTLADNPPTTGQLFSGFPWFNYVSEEQANNGLDKVFMVGVRQNAFFRSNIGLVNASQFSSTHLQVKLFNGTGQQIGSTFDQGLQPLGFAQPALSAMFGNGPFPDSMWVQVSQTGSALAVSDAPTDCQPPKSNGCPGFFAYGSVLDNQTTDPTTLEPQYFQSWTDSQIACIYPGVGQSNCKGGTPPLHRSVRKP